MPPIEPFEPQIKEQPWGWEELLARVPGVATTKRLTRRADGKRAGLQYHVSKSEAFFLLSGQAWVYHDPGDGQIVKTHMIPGMTFVIPPGTPHSVETIGLSVMLEASNDVSDDRVPVEAQYADQMRALGASVSVQG